MPRRTVLTLALLLATLTLIGLLPGHPAVRDPLLARVVDAAGDAGLDLRYARASGNLWRGVTLEGVAVRAPGIDLRAETARLGWFLPPLVAGELPLRVRLGGLAGEIDVERALAERAPAEAAPGAGLPLPRLLWREIDVDGADVTIADVPFTLPDVRIEDVAVTGDGDDLALALTLRTADGSASLVGRADAGSGHVTLDVIAADTTIARAWWDGVTGGVVRGEVRLANGVVTGDGVVTDGSIDAFGLVASDIHGSVRWDGARAHTELRGAAAGGTIDARGIVDVPAQRWHATGEADVRLEGLAPWLWSLGAAGAPPTNQGRVVGEIRAEGWTDVRLEVDATITEGDVVGFTVDDLGVEVILAEGRLEVLAAGPVAGGDLALRVASALGVTDVSAELTNAAWGPLEVDTLAGALRFADAQTGAATLTGRLALGEGVPLSADLSLDPDGAVLFVESAETGGALVRGAVATPRLAGDAPLDGQLHLLLPEAWWIGAAPDVVLDVGGLLAVPTFDVRVVGPEPVRPRAGPWAPAVDLRGTLSLTLEPGGVGLDGALGDVAVAGAIAAGRVLEVRVPALRWSGPTSLETDPLDLRLASEEGRWSLADTDGRLALGFAAEGWSADVTALGFEVAGAPLTLTGSATATQPAGWRADAVLDTPTVPVRIALTNDGAGRTRAELEAERLSASAEADAAGIEARLNVRDDELVFSAAEGVWRLDGAVDLGPLLPLAGIEANVTGRLASALAGDADGVTGDASLTLSEPVAVEAVVTAVDGALFLAADAAVAGERVTLAGRIVPDLALEAHLGPIGPVRLDAASGAGAGALPDVALGPLVLPLGTWRVDVDVDAARADLALGASALTVTWHDGVDAVLAVDQRIDAGAAPWAHLRGALGWSSSAPEGTLGLRVERAAGEILARLDGTLERAELGGSAEARHWSAILGDALVAAGRLDWQGVIAPNTGAVDVTASWSTGAAGAPLRLTARVDEGAATWSARANGLQADGDASGWQASLDGFDPLPWLASPSPDALRSLRLDGTLRQATAGWDGVLALELAATGDIAVAAELRGAGDALLLSGTARAAEGVADDVVELAFDGRWDGTAHLDLRLAAGAIGPLSWPQVAAQVRDEDGWSVRGDGGHWSLGAAAGRWEQPLWIAGEPHLLVLDASDQRLVRLTGALLSASAWPAREAWHVEAASATPAALARSLDPEVAEQLAPLSALTLQAMLDLEQPGAYTLEALGQWRAGTTAVPLAVALSGDTTRGTGALRIGPAEARWVTVEVAYDPSGARAEADLSELDVDALAAAFDVPVTGALTGSAFAGLVEGRADVGLESQGTLRVAGRDLAVDAHLADTAWRIGLTDATTEASTETPWRLDAEGDLAAGPDEPLARLALSGPQSDLRASLERLADAPGGGFRLAADGVLAERTTSLTLTGDADAAVAEARWDTLEVAAAWRDERLTLSAEAPDLALALHGDAVPLNLAGTLRWRDEQTTVALSGPHPEDPTWSARLDERLDLRWVDDTVHLEGSLARQLLDTDVTALADLRWSGAGGFDGVATVRLDDLPADASVTLDLVGVGTGELALELSARRAGEAAGGGHGRVAADPREGWSLDLDLDVPLAGDGFDRWHLAVSGQIADLGAGVTLDTALALGGPVTAHGRAWLDAGALRADLVGAGLSASARWDEAGGRAQLRLADADVRAWLPWLAAPRASLNLDATFATNGPVVVADELRLRLPGGGVSGQGRLGSDGRLDVTLRSDLDLADLRFGTALSGRLTGPVALTTRLDRPFDAAELAGVLVLSGARAEGLPGRFSGDLQVTGPAADPLVSLVLRADDGAEGSLRAQLRPRSERASIDANVRSGDLTLALQGQLAPDTLRADGRIGLTPTLALRVTSERGGVTIRLDDDPEALALHLARDPWRVHVGGDLAALSPALEGRVDADLRWPAEGPWPTPSGSVRGLAAAGVPLGDARIGGSGGARADWTLAGDWGDVAVALPAQRVALDVTGLALPPLGPDGSLDLALDGPLERLRLRASVSGALQDEAVALTLEGEVDARAGTGAVTLTGSALGGELSGALERSPAGVWRGGASLAAVLGDLDLRADLSLAGDGALPDLSADVTLGDLLVVVAGFDGEALALDARLALDDAALLRLEGRAWPYLDLQLDDPERSERGALRLRGSWDDPDVPLRAAGDLRVGLGPAVVGLQGTEAGTLRVRATSAWVEDGWLEQTLPAGPAGAVVAAVLADGLELAGRGSVQGRVAIDTALAIRVDGLTLSVAGVDVRVDGAAEGPTRLDARVRAVAGDALVDAPWWPTGFDPRAPLEAHVALADGRLVIAAEAPWTLELVADLAAGSASLRSDVTWTTPDGPAGLRGELRAAPGAGLSGALDLTNVVVGAAQAPPIRLDGALRGIGAGVDLDLTLRSRRSALSVRGRTPLPDAVQAAWLADAPPVVRSVDLRVAAIDLRDLPGVASAVPFLEGVVTGSVAVRGDLAVGQLVAGDLRVAEREIPLVATLAADLARPSADLRIEGTGGRTAGTGSNATIGWADGRFDALVRLERFPLHVLAEGLVGPSDVSAEVTGVVRGAWDPADATPFDLRVATEHVRLERAGVVTTGRLAFDLADGALRIQEASFTGRGAWEARGEVRSDRIDVVLSADDADFGPLLGLVPALNRYGVSAEGDLRVVGTGTFAQPLVAIASERLQVDVAGTSYELRDADVQLEGEQLAATVDIAALAPLTGALRLAGGGRVRLSPLDVSDVRFEAAGDLEVPLLGRIEAIEAVLSQRADGTPGLLVDGVLGAPFRIDGSLAPLDLRAVGRGLQLSLPFLFVGNAVLDADLRARVDDGLVLSGRVDASSVRIDLGARAAAAAPAEAEPLSPSERAARRAAQALVRFDDVRIVAPQRVTLSETIGTAEAAFDLTLSGDVAEPRLQGTANALRGTFRFSGRDFELVRADARFDPTQGVLPRISVVARSTFEKARVLVPGSAITFATPSGPRFEVVLAFDADVTTDAAGEVGLDLVPTLSSDATIEVPAGPNGIAAGARPLTDLEMLGLIALGRLEPGGGGTFAGAVAQTALDTALDLLVVSELQAALSEALGIDVVEIRTGALTDLFDGSGDPFSVSLRFGGYLSDELFASYRVGTFDDAERAFAFTNEVLLTYELGPVAFDLSGRLDFPVAGTGQPVPGVSAAVRYDISRSFALEAGVDLGTERQTARLGVTLRW